MSAPPTRSVPGRRPVDAADHVQQRRLAAAGFADDGDELAGGDFEVDVFQRVECAGGGFVGFGDVAAE